MLLVHAPFLTWSNAALYTSQVAFWSDLASCVPAELLPALPEALPEERLAFRVVLNRIYQIQLSDLSI